MVRNQIDDIVNQLVAKPSFLYGTLNELNLFSDSAKFPVVMLYSLKPVPLYTTLTNSISNKFSLYMEFLYQTTFDQYTSQNEVIIDQAFAMLQEFLVKMQYYRETPEAARFFKIHKDEPRTSVPVYNKLDVNSTGVNLTITVSTMNNQGYDPTRRPS